MKLLLVRHGETQWNVAKKIQGSADICLNETGRFQAAKLGKTLKEYQNKIAKIYTSKLLRAKETAEIIGAELNLEVKVLEGLEEMCMGLWEGMSWKNVEKEYPKEYQIWFQKRRNTRVPQGESYQEVLERLVPALQEIVKKEKEDTLVVTHSADIMSLMSCVYQTPFHEMIKHYKTENCGIVVLEGNDILNLQYSIEEM